MNIEKLSMKVLTHIHLAYTIRFSKENRCIYRYDSDDVIYIVIEGENLFTFEDFDSALNYLCEKEKDELREIIPNENIQ